MGEIEAREGVYSWDFIEKQLRGNHMDGSFIRGNCHLSMKMAACGPCLQFAACCGAGKIGMEGKMLLANLWPVASGSDRLVGRPDLAVKAFEVVPDGHGESQ